MPYHLAGLPVRGALSRHYLSTAHLDGVDCADLRARAGCLGASPR